MDLVQLETLRFEFYTYDLAENPIFNARVTTESGKDVWIGCLHAFYPHCDENYLRHTGWTFACGNPRHGVGYHTGSWPLVPTYDEAAKQLYEFVKYYVDYHQAQRSHDQVPAG